MRCPKQVLGKRIDNATAASTTTISPSPSAGQALCWSQGIQQKRKFTLPAYTKLTI